MLAPNKWDASKDDLKRSVAELTHFMPVERGKNIAFRLVETGDQYGENPPIGEFPKDEGIYNIFNANWSDEQGAYVSRKFSKAMEAGLDTINREATAAAMKQLELPLGAQYKAPKEGVNPFAFTYGYINSPPWKRPSPTTNGGFVCRRYARSRARKGSLTDGLS